MLRCNKFRVALQKRLIAKVDSLSACVITVTTRRTLAQAVRILEISSSNFGRDMGYPDESSS
jgi:hypothetical protein